MRCYRPYQFIPLFFLVAMSALALDFITLSGKNEPLLCAKEAVEGAAQNDSYENGRQALRKKNYKLAIRFFTGAAHELDPRAMSEILSLHDKNKIKDSFFSPEIAELYIKAAQTGNVMALHNLGRIYSRGLGVKRNYEKSIYYFMLSSYSSRT